MLSQINKRKISFKLNQIYNFLTKNEIDLITEEISQVINHFNRNNKKNENMHKNCIIHNVLTATFRNSLRELA